MKRQSYPNQETFSEMVLMGVPYKAPSNYSRAPGIQDLALAHHSVYGYVKWDLYGFRPMWRVA